MMAELVTTYLEWFNELAWMAPLFGNFDHPNQLIVPTSWLRHPEPVRVVKGNWALSSWQ